MCFDNPLVSGATEILARTLFCEQEFFEPSLADAAPDQLYTPEVVEDRLLPILEQHHLLMLGGRPDADKALFARQLAWHLKHRHVEHRHVEHRHVEHRVDGAEGRVVRQWVAGGSVIQIESALDRALEPSIFLFPGLEPHHLGGYDVRRFHDDLGRRGHKAIITTDSPIETWSATPEEVERSWWVDVGRHLLTETFLVEELILRLGEQAEMLPCGLTWTPGRPHHRLLIGGLTMAKVAVFLQSPARIRSFVVALASRSEVDEGAVRELLEHVADERRAVHHWFRGLAPRDQLLALGLALFDGLLDDQVFSCLEYLLEKAWREWDPTLAHFDYHELHRLRTYFRGFDAAGRTARIECASAACRRHLLEIGWSLHRRRMIAALPVLEALVRLSPDLAHESRRVEEAVRLRGDAAPLGLGRAAGPEGGGDDDAMDAMDAMDAKDEMTVSEGIGAPPRLPSRRFRDLFGSHFRNGLVRDRLASTLAEIGRLSVDAVEPVLVELASDARVANQHVAADAISRWRALDAGGEGETRLNSLLEAWRSEAFARELGTRRRGPGETQGGFRQVRATTALALSKAALYDPPNQLRPEFLRLFEDLLRDRSPVVRRRMKEHTVPLLLQAHLQQLETVVWRHVFGDRGLLLSAAVGIARAQHLRPAETRRILERWIDSVRHAAPSTGGTSRRREHVATLVAYVLGLLEPDRGDDGQGGFGADEIFEHLHGFLVSEKAPVVRNAALVALIRHAESDFESVEGHLRRTAGVLSLDERTSMVERIVAIYLRQRHEVSCGAASPAPDEVWTLDDLEQGLWLSSRRPRTRVEEVLRRWIDDVEQPAAIQWAVECHDAFLRTKVEVTERRRRTADLGSPSRSAPADAAARLTLRRLSWSGWLASYLAVPANRRERRIVQTALPEILRRRSTGDGADRSTGVPIADRDLIERVGDTDPILARQLGAAVRCHRLQWSLAVLILLSVLL